MLSMSSSPSMAQQLSQAKGLQGTITCHITPDPHVTLTSGLVSKCNQKHFHLSPADCSHTWIHLGIWELSRRAAAWIVVTRRYQTPTHCFSSENWVFLLLFLWESITKMKECLFRWVCWHVAVAKCLALKQYRI